MESKYKCFIEDCGYIVEPTHRGLLKAHTLKRDIDWIAPSHKNPDVHPVSKRFINSITLSWVHITCDFIIELAALIRNRIIKSIKLHDCTIHKGDWSLLMLCMRNQPRRLSISCNRLVILSQNPDHAINFYTQIMPFYSDFCMRCYKQPTVMTQAVMMDMDVACGKLKSMDVLTYLNPRDLTIYLADVN